MTESEALGLAAQVRRAWPQLEAWPACVPGWEGACMVVARGLPGPAGRHPWVVLADDPGRLRAHLQDSLGPPQVPFPGERVPHGT